MLKLLELCNREGLSQEEKAELTNCFPAPEKPGQEVVTFLYMQGEDKGWKPGKIGQMNGALIYPGAREYFRKHF
ncbi:MAG: hypothetical protein KAU35_00335 [candidate division Zixibacteria bacterium]|nr:hypothetical protein [candidate division Zixibacteria bacterium]